MIYQRTTRRSVALLFTIGAWVFPFSSARAVWWRSISKIWICRPMTSGMVPTKPGGFSFARRRVQQRLQSNLGKLGRLGVFQIDREAFP